MTQQFWMIPALYIQMFLQINDSKMEAFGEELVRLAAARV